MSYSLKFLLCALCSFGLCMLFSPLVIMLMRRLKARQEILCYVDKHKDKQGTPTIGGLAFLLAMAVTTSIFCYGEDKVGFVAMAVTLSYGLVGLLDDFIKVWHKENQGLKAYQKVIGQLGIAIIASIYSYKNTLIGSKIFIPFTSIEFDFGWWIMPLCILIYIAVTNSVNLTDGLDGLVAKTSSVYFSVFGFIIFIMLTRSLELGQTLEEKHLASLGYFTMAMLGAVLAFVWFNANPAQIFMGDTGSLAIGGAVTCIGLFSKNPILIPLISIMYMVSCISVIVQVISFKLRGKRVFLMAPYHHHLEYKGIKESKIVTYYTLITIFCGVIAIISILVR